MKQRVVAMERMNENGDIKYRRASGEEVQDTEGVLPWGKLI